MPLRATAATSSAFPRQPMAIRTTASRPHPSRRPSRRQCSRGRLWRWRECSLAPPRGIQAHGVDYRPAAVEIAKDLAARLDSSATFEVKDAFALDGNYDLAFSTGVLEHWEPPSDCGSP